MTDAWMAARTAYDLVAQSYAQVLPGPTAETPSDLAVLDDFARRVAGRGPVLDAGCGPGRMTRYLRDRDVEAFGIDLSAEMIRAARTLHPDLSFAVGSIDALDVESDSLVGVLAWYSIINTAPAVLPTVLAELLRVIAPGGWLLIGCQSGAGQRHIAHAYGHDVSLDAHLYTTASLGAELTELGAFVHTTVTRGPEGAEKHPQGTVLARRAG